MDSQKFSPLAADRVLIDQAFLRDPYPVYAALRDKAPLFWSEEFCGGAWLLSRYDDVKLALQDPRFSAQRASSWVNTSGAEAAHEMLAFKRILSRAMLFLDAPRHSRLRQVMNAGFRPNMIAALAPHITAIANTLIDRIETKARHALSIGQPQRFDFIEDFARPLPSLVMAQMLGVASADCPQFGVWADAIAEFIGSPTPTMELARAAQESVLALTEYFRALLPEQRRKIHAAPQQITASEVPETLLDLLLRAEMKGQLKTTKELLAQCAMLLFAGQETTRHLLGNSIFCLLENQNLWQQIQTDSERLPSAIREVLRYESPVQYTGRRLSEDLILHGCSMKKGQLVIALIGAANRDPERFTQAAQFDINRREGKHLSFGFGPHVCIGASLTLLETELALRRIMVRIPGLALVKNIPKWGNNPVYRGINTLECTASFTIQQAFDRSENAACREDLMNETSFV